MTVCLSCHLHNSQKYRLQKPSKANLVFQQSRTILGEYALPLLHPTTIQLAALQALNRVQLVDQARREY